MGTTRLCRVNLASLCAGEICGCLFSMFENRGPRLRLLAQGVDSLEKAMLKAKVFFFNESKSENPLTRI